MKTKRRKQQDALARLENQLDTGLKTQKGTKDVKIPLTDKDRVRINREIQIIKEKLK